MFYETRDFSRDRMKALGLSHDPMKAIIAPRPIGWISSMSAAGEVNLAPFSFFNAASTDPPMVFFGANGAHEADGGEKDTLRNVRETGEFVCNLVTWDLRMAMNDSSAPAPRGVDEMEAVGLAKLPSRVVRVPRVAGTPAHLECTLHQCVELPVEKSGKRNVMVIGRVVAVHIDDAFIVAGRFDTARAKPVGRLGYYDYAVVDSLFEIPRPSWPIPARTAAR